MTRASSNHLGPLPKPRMGEPCNGCGYCCTAEPCGLAREFLHCVAGPCVALEAQEERTICGLVRNPLGYLFKAAHPDADVPTLDAPPALEEAQTLSRHIAAALGIGRGCDADDDEEAAAWGLADAERVLPGGSEGRAIARPDFPPAMNHERCTHHD